MPVLDPGIGTFLSVAALMLIDIPILILIDFRDLQTQRRTERISPLAIVRGSHI
ncbi:MAG: hypothetical protein O3B64_01790 [bacterium]|nr:hypothetical protein [bacterium]MDA1024356.1 hypothetical protein [bacterium]